MIKAIIYAKIFITTIVYMHDEYMWSCMSWHMCGTQRTSLEDSGD